MFRNYLLAAWRNLLRQKLYACINIFGLAIGLCVFILIFLYVEKEYSWDRQWRNAGRIHWLTLERRLNGTNSFKNPSTPYQINSVVMENFPESIERSARMVSRGSRVQVGEERYTRNIMHVEREFFDIFDVEVLNGSMAETLAGPGRVALQDEVAERFFGTADPLGKTITLEVMRQSAPGAEGATEYFDYQVSAVYRVPEESIVGTYLGAVSLLDEGGLPEHAADLDNWWGPVFSFNFFVLKANADVAAMNARMRDLVNTVIPREPWRNLRNDEQNSDYVNIRFEPVVAAHFDEKLFNSGADKSRVVIFGLIGFLVLMMGSINFVILATAKAEDRRREVGVRKVLGGKKSQLILQFLGESVFHTVAALVLAVALALVTLPVFGSLIGQELSLGLTAPKQWLQLLALALAVGILGGLYPAFVLADFSPVSVFREKTAVFAGGRLNVRSLLAAVQFSIAIMLIVATLVLFFQLNLVRNLDPGFRTENLFAVNINFQERQLVEPYVNSLSALPGVEQITTTSRRPGPQGTTLFINYTFSTDRLGIEADSSGTFVNYNFFDLYEIPLLAGRVFDPQLDKSADIPPANAEELRQRRERILINRYLASALGFESPEAAVGEIVYSESTLPGGEVRKILYEVIGVVENSQFSSLREPVVGETYTLRNQTTPVITIRYSDAIAGTLLADAESIWKAMEGDTFFRGIFIDQILAEEFLQEENEGRLLLTFSLLSIFIACMGLYGLAAYTVKKSVKEVGVRKVLGAKFGTIMLLFGWRFSIPVLIANVVAWPVALWAMLRWLQRFPEQIDYLLLGPICLLATLLALLIAWLTVGATTARAARADPVKSLRYE